MLAFLDTLCTALLARDARQILELLRHPLARALPRPVREEALLIARRGRRALIAPVQTLRFYHQTTHLLRACGDPAVETARQESVPIRQLEIFATR